MRSAIAAGLAAASMLVGCSSDCDLACDNFARVCDGEFRASGIEFDRGACSSSCESNLPRCSNDDARLLCLSKAKTCDAARGCPACE